MESGESKLHGLPKNRCFNPSTYRFTLSRTFSSSHLGQVGSVPSEELSGWYYTFQLHQQHGSQRTIIIILFLSQKFCTKVGREKCPCKTDKLVHSGNRAWKGQTGRKEIQRFPHTVAGAEIPIHLAPVLLLGHILFLNIEDGPGRTWHQL